MPDDDTKKPGNGQTDLSCRNPKDSNGHKRLSDPDGLSALGSVHRDFGPDIDPGPDDPPVEIPKLDEIDIAQLRIKHGDLLLDLDRLAELKRRADAGAIEHAVFEAELLALAERRKKKGMTAAKARAAVAERLRPPMDDEEAWKKLLAAGAQRDEVLQLGLTGELWHDPDLEAYATIERSGRRQTWKVRSRDYRLHLSTEYRNRHGRVPTGQALAEGIEAIEAAARGGSEHEAFVRVARAGGKIYLDLVNEARTVVQIDAAGWRVIGNPPVHFIRPRGLRALPDPRPCSGEDGSPSCRRWSTCRATTSSFMSAGSSRA
jgi:hypothetical protein